MNTAQRFAELHIDYDPGEAPVRVKTKFFRDHSSSIITKNDSPDLSFEGSINPYRGCEHGCAYCYARPTHEYLGFSAGTDFESRIMVKDQAPELLRAELCRPSYRPMKLSLSGVTDPYQPIERRLGITRGCLEVLAEARHPVVIITKNHLVTRDLDLLTQLAQHRAVAVYLSVTTLDSALGHRLEPRASSPTQRLEAIRQLRSAGVPVGVSIAPVIPALTDHEVPAIVAAAVAAGARFAGSTVVRLPYSVKEVFAAWLEQHFPERKAKVLGRIADTQGETMSHAEFGKRLKGEGMWAEQIWAIYKASLRRHGLDGQRPEVTTDNFRRPQSPDGQMELQL